MVHCTRISATSASLAPYAYLPGNTIEHASVEHLIAASMNGVMVRGLLLFMDAIGVTKAKVEQLLAGKGAFLSVEPERRLRALHAAAKGRGKGPLFKDGAAATWGIQAVNILGSKLTGKGVKLAVLDTGFRSHVD